jgi:hypothetical protein
MKKISHKPHKQTKSTEEILLSQRKENIKGYLNQIIRIKKHNNLKLAEIEDKIIQHKFDVDTSKEISNKNIKQHFKDLIRSESFNVKVNKIDFVYVLFKFYDDLIYHCHGDIEKCVRCRK